VSKIFSSKKKEVSKSEIDPRIYDSVLRNLQFAEEVSAIPYEPYRGMMVAPFTRDYMEGEAATRRIAREGGFVPEVEAAARNAQALMGYQPERISAGQIGTQFGARDIGASLAGGPERVAAGAIGTTFGAAPIGAERVGAALGRGPATVSAERLGTTFAPERIAARDIGASLAGGPSRISASRVGAQFAPERVAAGQLGTAFAARDVSAPGAAPMAQGASVLGRDIGEYMNPYERQVIEAGLGDISRAEERARGGRSARATAARAFGGSRAAIEEGIAAGEAARERNRFVAEQRAQGFREASAMREADVGRQQQAGLANQAAAQQVMELAQRGQITNQQRDIELSRLGLTAGQANIDAQMRAALANQQAQQEAQRLGLTAETTNVQAALEAERANQAAAQQYMQMGLSAEEANQRAQMDAATRNQAAAQEAQRLGLTAGQFNVEQQMRAGLANQQAVQDYMRMGLSAEQANQQAALDAAGRNQQATLEAQRLGSTAQQFNVEQQMRAGLANQQAVQQYMQMGLSAEEANQRAMLDAQRMGSTAQQFNVQTGMDAARANQAAAMQGAQFQLGAGRQLADLGQTALANRYESGRAMMGLGTQQQNLYQQFLNAQREEDLRRQEFPLRQLAIRQGAVSASPYNVTQTGTVTGRQSPFDIGMRFASMIPMGGAPTPGSDERMKRNIGGIKNPLDKVRRLKGIEFEWEDGYGENEGEDKGGEEDMGMSAQSVERAMPEAVSRRESDNMRQYDLPQVVGLLTEAVKELDKKVGGKRRGRA
jgi:hypothetical protein